MRPTRLRPEVRPDFFVTYKNAGKSLLEPVTIILLPKKTGSQTPDSGRDTDPTYSYRYSYWLSNISEKPTLCANTRRRVTRNKYLVQENSSLKAQAHQAKDMPDGNKSSGPRRGKDN